MRSGSRNNKQNDELLVFEWLTVFYVKRKKRKSNQYVQYLKEVL